jgi:hypothetical protein
MLSRRRLLELGIASSLSGGLIGCAFVLCRFDRISDLDQLAGGFLRVRGGPPVNLISPRPSWPAGRAAGFPRRLATGRADEPTLNVQAKRQANKKSCDVSAIWLCTTTSLPGLNVMVLSCVVRSNAEM